MKPTSLFQLGNYSLDWVKDFYTQAGIWWGPDVQEPPNTEEPGGYKARAETVERLCGREIRRVLDLGAGSGRTAAAIADLGHTVVGVELNPTDIGYAQDLLTIPHLGSLTMLEGDYYTIKLDGQFDVVCWWQGFGIGTDADQRRMLRRIAYEWLTPGGCALIDVYNPVRAARHAGEEVHLEALEGVPGSVAMIERCHFDPVYSRWIDEWQPTVEPAKALAQTVRCYTPMDFLLLLEGTGLALKRIEVDGCEVDFSTNQIALSGPLMEAWGYLAQLIPIGGAA